MITAYSNVLYLSGSLKKTMKYYSQNNGCRRRDLSRGSTKCEAENSNFVIVTITCDLHKWRHCVDGDCTKQERGKYVRKDTSLALIILSQS